MFPTKPSVFAARWVVGASVLLTLTLAIAASAEPGDASQAGAAGSAGGPSSKPALDGSAGEAWWQRALDELLAGIELSPDQDRGVDEILERAGRDRAQYRRHVAGLREASRQGDSERAQLLREELNRSRKRMQPARRIDEIRGVLDPEQQQTFDRNRRLRSDRLLVERRKQSRERGEQPRRAAPEAQETAPAP